VTSVIVVDNVTIIVLVRLILGGQNPRLIAEVGGLEDYPPANRNAAFCDLAKAVWCGFLTTASMSIT